MAQARVTEYFNSRKKTFDVIQPSKKAKLDSDVVLDFKTKLKPAVTLSTKLPTSAKRSAKRKQVTAPTGNIKSFLENSARCKLPKLGEQESVNSKVNTDSMVWQTGTKSKQEPTKAPDSMTRNSASVDKQAVLREKIKAFKESVNRVRAPEKTELGYTKPTQVPQSPPPKEEDSSLILPFKYRKLYEMFRATETVVSMLYNRKEVCTFDKLKQSVQQLTKRAFQKEQLGQIASVFQQAYIIQLEKGITTLSSGSRKAQTYRLTITPILSSEGRMSPSIVLERRKVFYKNLVNITKQHHASFLANLNPPIHVPGDKVMQWHPRFRVDDVPDIAASSLPETTEQKVSTAKDVLQKMNGIVCSRIEKALQSVANEQTSPTPVQTKPKPLRIASGPLKGISQALLDKIRNKENAKISRDMLRKPESEKRIGILAQLPEIVHILRTLFVVEKRAAIPLEDVKVKVCDSFHSPIGPDDVEQHLKLLCSIVPKWITYVTIPRGVFVKIDKNLDLKDVTTLIEAEIVKEKSM